MTVKKAITVSCCVVPLLALVPLAIHYNMVHREVQQTLCVHNLKLLGMALHQYADDNEGEFPHAWSGLYPEYLGKDPVYVIEVFHCPLHSRSKEPDAASIDEEFFNTSDYVLVPGGTMGDDKDTVLAYEREDNHSAKGRAVLYVDGRCGWKTLE
jgi:hypothetical protein